MLRYRINSPKVIHQVFDTEVVVVNLETGSYYSLEGAGIDIWRFFEATRSFDEVSAAMRGRADDTDAGKLEAFLRELADEALIVPDENAAAHSPAPLAAIPKHSLGEARLRKFTDMRDLLLLDPIHELDESGWPQRPQPQAQA